MEDNPKVIKKDESSNKSCIPDEESKSRLLKQKMIFDQQQRDVWVGFSSDIFSILLLFYFLLVSAFIPNIIFAGTKANPSHYKIWYPVYENEV